MHKSVIAPDRVLLLLSLVAFLRDSDAPVAVSVLAERFSVSPKLIRDLVRFLGTAGVPGETMSYQDEDLFDLDWDLLEGSDEVWLTRTVAVDEAPRFAPAETVAIVAGLNALIPVLGDDDAALARELSSRLGAALGGQSAAAVSITADRQDERIPAILAAIDRRVALAFEYRDAAGVPSSRRVEPLGLQQGEGAWYLRAYCLDRRAERTFRVEQISALRELSDTAAAHPSLPESADSEPIPALVAVVAERALPRLGAFAPELLGEAGEGRIRVRITAWHRAAAIALIQAAPGLVLIEEPESARHAVREWAERGLAAYGE